MLCLLGTKFGYLLFVKRNKEWVSVFSDTKIKKKLGMDLHPRKSESVGQHQRKLHYLDLKQHIHALSGDSSRNQYFMQGQSTNFW